MIIQSVTFDKICDIHAYNRVKLTTLTKVSNKCIADLKTKHEKGEAIIRLAEMCRKLETEEEKVLPFYSSSLTEAEEAEISAAVNSETENQFAEVKGHP